jgi:hypothetical protein
MTSDSTSGSGDDRILADLFAAMEERGSGAIQEYRLRFPHLAGEIDRLVPLHVDVDRTAEPVGSVEIPGRPLGD